MLTTDIVQLPKVPFSTLCSGELIEKKGTYAYEAYVNRGNQYSRVSVKKWRDTNAHPVKSTLPPSNAETNSMPIINIITMMLYGRNTCRRLSFASCCRLEDWNHNGKNRIVHNEQILLLSLCFTLRLRTKVLIYLNFHSLYKGKISNGSRLWFLNCGVTCIIFQLRESPCNITHDISFFIYNGYF